jgi:uncharacterized membrane protein
MKKNHILIMVACAILLTSSVGIYLLVTGNQPKEGNHAQNPVIPAQNATDILIPVGNLTATAQFYSYDSGGITIRYFLVKDAQGNVHGAMDACDVCYAAKKGYRQNGDVMHCINCGREFSITSLGTDNLEGGCWPSHLPITTSSGNVTIKISDLVSKQYMFE